MELFWEKVLGLRISKKLVEVCTPWGFNIRYFNSIGQEIRSVYRSDTTACSLIEHTPAAKQVCDICIKKISQAEKESRQSAIEKCPAGLTVLVVPILNRDDCLGFVVAAGVLDRPLSENDRQDLKAHLSSLDVNIEEYEKILQDFPIVTHEKLEVFKGLLETMVDEVTRAQRDKTRKFMRTTQLAVKEKFDFSSII